MSEPSAKYASTSDEAEAKAGASDAVPLQVPAVQPSSTPVVPPLPVPTVQAPNAAGTASAHSTSRAPTPVLNLGGAPSMDRTASVSSNANAANMTPEAIVSLKNEVFEKSVTIHQLKQRIIDLEKMSSGAGAAPNSARVQLEGVQLKLVNANNQVDGLRAELQRVIKQRDLQMEKAEADAKVLQEQIAALVEKATQMVDKSMLEHANRKASDFEQESQMLSKEVSSWKAKHAAVEQATLRHSIEIADAKRKLKLAETEAEKCNKEMAAIKQQHDEQTQALTDAKSRAETAEKLSEKAVEEKTAAETALNNMTAEMSDLKLRCEVATRETATWIEKQAVAVGETAALRAQYERETASHKQLFEDMKAQHELALKNALAEGEKASNNQNVAQVEQAVQDWKQRYEVANATIELQRAEAAALANEVLELKKSATDDSLAAKIATERLLASTQQLSDHESKIAAQAQKIKELSSQVESLQFPNPLATVNTTNQTGNSNSNLIPGDPDNTPTPQPPSRMASTDPATSASVTQLQARWQSLAEQWQEKYHQLCEAQTLKQQQHDLEITQSATAHAAALNALKQRNTTTVTTLEQERNDALSTIDRLQHQLVEKEKEIVELTASVTTLKSNFAEQSIAFEQLKATHAETQLTIQQQKDLVESAAAIKKSAAPMEALQAECAALANASKASQQELVAAQAELAEIRPILIIHAKCHTEATQLHNKVAMLMEKLAEAEKSQVLLRSGMNRLREHEAQMDSKFKTMEDELRKLREQRQVSQKKREEIEKKYKDLSESVGKQLDAKANEFRAQISQNMSEISLLKDMLRSAKISREGKAAAGKPAAEPTPTSASLAGGTRRQSTGVSRSTSSTAAAPVDRRSSGVGTTTTTGLRKRESVTAPTTTANTTSSRLQPSKIGTTRASSTTSSAANSSRYGQGQSSIPAPPPSAPSPTLGSYSAFPTSASSSAIPMPRPSAAAILASVNSRHSLRAVSASADYGTSITAAAAAAAAAANALPVPQASGVQLQVPAPPSLDVSAAPSRVGSAKSQQRDPRASPVASPAALASPSVARQPVQPKTALNRLPGVFSRPAVGLSASTSSLPTTASLAAGVNTGSSSTSTLPTVDTSKAIANNDNRSVPSLPRINSASRQPSRSASPQMAASVEPGGSPVPPDQLSTASSVPQSGTSSAVTSARQRQRADSARARAAALSAALPVVVDALPAAIIGTVPAPVAEAPSAPSAAATLAPPPAAAAAAPGDLDSSMAEYSADDFED